jgi:hypothetical protein
VSDAPEIVAPVPEEQIPGWLDHVQEAIARAVLARPCHIKSRPGEIEPSKETDALIAYLDPAARQLAEACNEHLMLRSPAAITRWLRVLEASWLVACWGAHRIALDAKYLIELGATLPPCACKPLETSNTKDTFGLVPLEDDHYLCGDCEQVWHWYEPALKWRRGKLDHYQSTIPSMAPPIPEPVAPPKIETAPDGSRSAHACECEALPGDHPEAVAAPDCLAKTEEQQLGQNLHHVTYTCTQCGAVLTHTVGAFEDGRVVRRWQRAMPLAPSVRTVEPAE